jgi:hypothetical protein
VFVSLLSFSLRLVAIWLLWWWSPRVGRRLLWDDTRWQEGFWWVLSCIAASDDDALATPLRQGLSPASFAVLSCFKHFAEDPEYCTHVIKQVCSTYIYINTPMSLPPIARS